jgi:hypothetical protein
VRTDTPAFAKKNLELAKDPRYVIELAFDSASTILWYFTSHADAALPPSGVAGSILGVVQGLSGTSQTLNPDLANASIGSISFSLVDLASIVTTTLGAQLQLGRSTRQQRVRIYVGYQGLAWADYTLVQTQLVSQIAYSDGAYKFSCADVQRLLRKDLFDIAKTNLAVSVLADDTSITVVSTAGFSTVAHGTSYSDAPSATVGYVKIEDEVIRYTGSDATHFTGCTRGALNTRAVDHLIDPTVAEERQTPVAEYVYLELPAVDLLYRLLTGKDRLGNPVMPATWNLGVALNYVRLSDFTGIGKDLWDTSDDQQGFIVRFEDLTKTDGKKFVETELALLIGAFMPVYADGALGLKRMANILAGAAYTGILDESNLVSVGDLVHDFDSLHNVITISWNWDPLAQDFTRADALIDAASIATHGRADPLSLSFRGLHGSRHSSIVIRQRFDALRDRYSGPPQRLECSALPSQNTAEVGDVKRVKLANVRDFAAPGGGGSLDRSFEIQNIQIDWITGAIKKKLFASSQAAGAIAPTSDATVLTSAYRTGTGTAITAALTTSGTGPVHVTASGTLTGSADMNAAGSIFYVDDDLQIDAGVTVKLVGNVQIRSKFLQINGKLDGKAGGLAGAAALVSPASASSYAAGTVDVIGTTEAGGGLFISSLSGLSIFSVLGGFAKIWSYVRGGIVKGLNDVLPFFTLDWDGVALSGTPGDLRGSSGSSGMPFALVGTLVLTIPGGKGGNSGAGLMLVNRGMALGANGSIDLSGGDGSLGSSVQEVSSGSLIYAGSGAGGAPGGLLVLLDGAVTSATGLTDVGFIALQGKTPIPPNSGTYEDWRTTAGINMRSSFVGTGDGTTFPLPTLSDHRGAARVQYVPGLSQAQIDLQKITDLAIREEFIANNFVSRTPSGIFRFEDVIWAKQLSTWVTGGGVGNSQGKIYTSPDGNAWTSQTISKTLELYGLAFDGTTIVAVGWPDTDAYIITSTNGTSWTERVNPKAFLLRSVAFGAGLFVAVGDDDGGDSYIVTSPDGTTWTERANPRRAGLRKVIWTGTSFVAVGGWDSVGSPHQAYVITSPDGITWTQRNVAVSGAATDTLFSVAFCSIIPNASLVAIGQSITPTQSYLITSADGGITWTLRTGAVPNEINGCGGIAASPHGVYVAGGALSGQIWTSFDGANWKKGQQIDFVAGANTHAIAFNGKRWIMVGENSSGSSNLIEASLVM